MENIGKFALKLERYRYNMIASISWVIFGSIFATAVMTFNALMLLGFDWYVVFTIVPAGVVSLIVFHKVRKLVCPIDSKRWKREWIFFALPFIVSYTIVPQFLSLNDLQMSTYFSTMWYPSLGVAFLLVGLFIERKDEMLVTKTMLPAGILTLATSVPLAFLCEGVKSSYDVIAIGLIATALMLSIYTACALYGFFKGYKALFTDSA
ncbi:hypothetical protein [Archaeoglobus sp.]